VCTPYSIASTPPPVLNGRPLSVRAYAADGMMLDAEVTDGGTVVPLLQSLFDAPETAYAHIHFARRGCYACRVVRA
jgi:hypothetical protein